MQLCSEVFNLSVKRLSRGISGTIDEIVEYLSLSISNDCGNSTEILSPKSDNKEYIWQGGKLGLGLQFYVELAIANTLVTIQQ